MQAILLEFPVSEPMTVSEDRFNKLANRVKALEEGKSSNVNDLASSDQSRKMDRTTILSAVAIVITLILGFVGATHTIDSEIANKIGPLDTRITKAEGAIKALADQQNDQTQKLVRDLLATAKNTPQADVATRILEATGSVVTELQRQKRPANPDFFKAGIDALDQVEQEHGYLPAAFSTRVKFAEYRSSEELLPRPQVELRFGKMEHAIINPGNIRGYELDFSEVSGNAIVLSRDPRYAKDITVANIRIDGGYQIVDGIHWHDVYFVGTKIRYEGGMLDLKDVHFINCTFEFPEKVQPTPRDRQLIDYAALAESELEFPRG